MPTPDPQHAPSQNATHLSIEAVWRIESARVIAALTRLTRDLALAEDLAQEAFVAALEQWPKAGPPANPAGWLITTGRHRAIDLFRRNALARRKHAELARELEALELTPPDLATSIDDPVADDLLRLIFISCHPILSTEARVALTLRLLGGLTTAEIARAFLIPESTVAQRIVRAKRTLARERIAFEVPRGPDLQDRLTSVLEVVYLIFNEGYCATAGDDLMRPTLCQEALRLGRILAELAPAEPEVHGLVALMELQASRTRARVSPTGEPILLPDQNRALWDPLLIRRGLAALERALAIGGSRGVYVLQAELAACHARSRNPAETDWPRMVSLYTELVRLTASPVVELNRAVAISMAEGPQAALPLVEALADHPALDRYHLLPSVQADLLHKLGRHAEACHHFQQAANLTQNARERALLLERASACSGPAGSHAP